jgi:phosphoglycolate phosphatase
MLPVVASHVLRSTLYVLPTRRGHLHPLGVRQETSLAFDMCFFDLDGTLVDSGPPIIDSLNEALDRHGLDPVSHEHAHVYIGPPLYDTITDLLVERGQDPTLMTSVLAAYREVYATRSLTETVVYPGIVDMLASVGTRIGVVTSKPRATAVPILESLGLAELFELIEGPALTSPEPKSATLGRALTATSIAPARTAMIGDRRHDIEAGRHHGTHTVGVTWGFGSPEELRSAGADRLVDNPAALGALLP